MLKYLLILMLLPMMLFAQEKYTLSIAAIFQNEAIYLNEWIEYHHMHGVEHFWLYNNNSEDDYAKVLEPWIDDGIVELIQWPSVQNENDWHHFSFTVQTGAYNDALQKAKNVSKWLALIDTDEFIVSIDFFFISDCLEYEYSNVSGLCVNWQCYGTSNVKKCKSMLNELVYKMKWDHENNKYSKSIVQPLHVSHCPNPHYCIYNSGHWAIDSHYNRCNGCPSYVSIDKIRINHYWTRDEYFLYNVKLPRYIKWGSNIENFLKHANSMNEEYDPILTN